MCLLLHIKKVIDTALLMCIQEKFTPARRQFGFQAGIAVSQAMIEENINAMKELHRTAVLDLAKAYNGVDRNKLMTVMNR